MEMIYLILAVAILIVAYLWIMNLPAFGSEPKGRRMQRIKQSRFYKNRRFQNISHTPSIAEGYSTVKVTYDFILGKKHPLLKP